jgi:hypothetical protein
MSQLQCQSCKLQTLNQLPKFQAMCHNFVLTSVPNICLCVFFPAKHNRLVNIQNFGDDFLKYFPTTSVWSRNSSVGTVTTLRAERSGVRFPVWSKICILYKCAPDLGTTQPHIRWLSGGSFPHGGGKATGA